MSTITREQWEQVTHALRFYIDAESARLSTMNASDTDWQRLEEFKGTLIDIEFYVLMK